MTNPKAPPLKKKKMTNAAVASLNPTSTPSISSLPDEIIVDCLARVSKSYYRSICLVSKSFYSLLSAPEIYKARSLIGATEPRIYVGLWLPTPTNNPWFTLGETEGELSLVPVRLSSSYSPTRLNSTTVAVGYEIYLIGGTVEGKLSRAVSVLDCQTHTWRRGPNLTVPRKCAKSWFLDRKIYVIGGCIKRKDIPMIWGEVLDLKTQTWKPLISPSDDDSIHKVAVFGAKLYVFTQSNNNYAYNPKEERWVKEVGIVGLEPLTIIEPWCVINNVMFRDCDRKYKWYSQIRNKWFRVNGLLDLYVNRNHYYSTIDLVNYGGKLLIVWHERAQFRSQDKKIWCAVIRLEERLTRFGIEIWGEVERCNVVVPTVPKTYKLSNCLSVSV